MQGVLNSRMRVHCNRTMCKAKQTHLWTNVIGPSLKKVLGVSNDQSDRKTRNLLIEKSITFNPINKSCSNCLVQ